MTCRNWGLACAALAQVACHQVILTAPPGSSITLFANPLFIAAHGGVSVITALLIEPAGTPVSDGTVVQCFTTLGHIDEQGKTNDGVARVNLISDSRSGTAHVVCVSGAPGSVDIVIGSALPTAVQLTADPPQIRTDAPRESFISAFVFDANGNFVVNVPVIFTLKDPAAANTERLEGEGQPVFTDNNGRAQDVLRTQYVLDAVPKSVIVVATTANGKTAEVTVRIN